MPNLHEQPNKTFNCANTRVFRCARRVPDKLLYKCNSIGRDYTIIEMGMVFFFVIGNRTRRSGDDQRRWRLCIFVGNLLMDFKCSVKYVIDLVYPFFPVYSYNNIRQRHKIRSVLVVIKSVDLIFKKKKK